MAYDARAAANLLLDMADARGLGLTHMSIHKVLFFAHGWRLAACDEPLLVQPFEAWKYGPVIRSLWDAFKDFGDKRVTGRARSFNPMTGTSAEARALFSTADEALLAQIMQAYGPLPATRLSAMTHRRGGAWDRVWNTPRENTPLGMRLSDYEIRRDFQEQSPLHTFARA